MAGRWNGKGMGEGGPGLSAVLFRYFPRGTKEKHENFGMTIGVSAEIKSKHVQSTNL
jgi:hypothetical protein